MKSPKFGFRQGHSVPRARRRVRESPRQPIAMNRNQRYTGSRNPAPFSLFPDKRAISLAFALIWSWFLSSSKVCLYTASQCAIGKGCECLRNSAIRPIAKASKERICWSTLEYVWANALASTPRNLQLSLCAHFHELLPALNQQNRGFICLRLYLI